ncbi:MAG: 2-phosphosulfolactate phosphatase [Dehalococcoidia bacterium]
MLERIELALLPAEAAAIATKAYIVVDVLRATTTIATLFARGMTSLVAAGRIELARELAASEHRLLMGEVHGLPPEGFDFGNSPVEAAAAPVAGRGGVLFTTNGTAALCLLAGRGAVFAGAAANATALAAYVAARYASATVVCAGNGAGARFSLEDFAAAGMIAGALSDAAPAAALGMRPRSRATRPTWRTSSGFRSTRTWCARSGWGTTWSSARGSIPRRRCRWWWPAGTAGRVSRRCRARANYRAVRQARSSSARMRGSGSRPA